MARLVLCVTVWVLGELNDLEFLRWCLAMLVVASLHRWLFVLLEVNSALVAGLKERSSRWESF